MAEANAQPDTTVQVTETPAGDVPAVEEPTTEAPAGGGESAPPAKETPPTQDTESVPEDPIAWRAWAAERVTDEEIDAWEKTGKPPERLLPKSRQVTEEAPKATDPAPKAEEQAGDATDDEPKDARKVPERLWMRGLKEADREVAVEFTTLLKKGKTPAEALTILALKEGVDLPAKEKAKPEDAPQPETTKKEEVAADELGLDPDALPDPPDIRKMIREAQVERKKAKEAFDVDAEEAAQSRIEHLMSLIPRSEIQSHERSLAAAKVRQDLEAMRKRLVDEGLSDLDDPESSLSKAILGVRQSLHDAGVIDGDDPKQLEGVIRDIAKRLGHEIKEKKAPISSPSNPSRPQPDTAPTVQRPVTLAPGGRPNGQPASPAPQTPAEVKAMVDSMSPEEKAAWIEQMEEKAKPTLRRGGR